MKNRFAEIAAPYPHSLVVAASRPVLFQQHDVSYPYESGPIFRWLSQSNIPQCILLYVDGLLHSFLPKHDPTRWQWEGPQVDLTHPGPVAGDLLHPIDDFGALLRQWLPHVAYVIVDPHDHHIAEHLRAYAMHASLPEQVDLAQLVGHARASLDAHAHTQVARALEFTGISHLKLMREAHTCPHEQAMHGQFIAAGFWHGAHELAYPPIIAVGAHATVLHHQPTTSAVDPSDWLLVDAGWRESGYCSDITRSYPLNKKAHGLRKAIYEGLLSVHQALIHAVKPGMTWRRLNQMAHQKLNAVLCDLGIHLPLDPEARCPYFRHSVGHWLGLEVHERLSSPHGPTQDLPWHAQMLLTVEPGLYFRRDDPNIPETLHGFGLRIEDNLWLTETGALNLSAHIPIHLEDLAHV